MKRNPKRKPDTAALLRHLIVRNVIPELEQETDEGLALRKALLLLILSAQDEAEDGAKELIQYLLTAFDPLTRHFQKHTHPFVGDHFVACAREHDKNELLLVIPKDFLDQILGSR